MGLYPRDHVWITDMKEKGTVSARVDTPWSYHVQTPRVLLRRHRSHLVTLPEPQAESADLSNPVAQSSTPLNSQAAMYATTERNLPRYLKDLDTSQVPST